MTSVREEAESSTLPCADDGAAGAGTSPAPSGAWFQAVFELHQSIMLIVDPTDGRIVDANQAAARYYGYPRDRLQQMQVFELNTLPRDDVRERMRLAAEQPHTYVVFPHRLADGSLRHVEVHSTPIELGGRRLFFSIIHDITERRQAEEALRSSESRYRTLIETMSDGFAVQDAHGRLTYVNQRLCEMLGFERDELLGRRVAELGDRATLTRAIQEVDGPPDEIELVSRTGELVSLRVAPRALLGEDGEYQGAFAVVSDMTRHKALETQLRHAQKMEAVGRLAGGVAHDFNNLLSAIIGYSEMAAGQLDTMHPASDSVDRVLDAGHRARDVTQHLLAFSRKQVLQMKVANLSRITSDLEHMLHPLMGADVELVTDLDEEIASVRADPSQIEQVLMNLCVNSRDAMPEGGRIDVRCESIHLTAALEGTPDEIAPGDYACLTVRDCGEGIPEETLANIFEPFFTTKPQGAGTGLGLSTIYGIVKQHGGYVTVESMVDEGTEFRVYLPIVEAKPELPDEETREDFPLEGTETVLLAEDEGVVRGLVRDILESFGYVVIVAGSGAEALRAAKRARGDIDLLLTDVIMPGMRGTELYRELVQQRPDVKVLFMSGYTDDVLGDADLVGGEGRFLQKPFSVDQLMQRVRGVLDGRLA